MTPHRKRRPGFHNAPAQNPAFVPFNPGFETPRRLQAPHPLSISAPPYLVNQISILISSPIVIIFAFQIYSLVDFSFIEVTSSVCTIHTFFEKIEKFVLGEEKTYLNMDK